MVDSNTLGFRIHMATSAINSKGCWAVLLIAGAVLAIAVGGPCGCFLVILAAVALALYFIIRSAMKPTPPRAPQPIRPGTAPAYPRVGTVPSGNQTNPMGGFRIDATTSGMSPFSSRRTLAKDPTPFWMPAGKAVEAASFSLGPGMLYVGSGLASVDGSGIEPALIDPALPVGKSTDYRLRQLGYWPSYHGASPDARSSYLFWLRNGRSDPKADLGYVFLYYYGLERRVLNEASQDPSLKGELEAIETEVKRLMSIYGGSGSFHSYAGSLLDYLKASREKDALQIPTAVPTVTAQYGLSWDLRLGLGFFATQGKPVPPAWALSWFRSHAGPFLKTAAKRCEAEFDALFLSEYRKKFGEGMKLPENKTRLKVVHRTASASFGPGTLTAELNLPDVSVLTGPVNKLQQIADVCYPQLDGYSRFLGRNADKVGTLEALLMLPPALWPEAVRAPMAELQQRVDAAGGSLVVPFLDLQLRLPESGDLTKTKFSALCRALGAMGLGVEPDTRFDGTLPQLNESIALFKADGLAEDRPVSSGFAFADLAVHLASAVAHADGQFGPDEEAILTTHMASWLHLPESDRLRLSARLKLMQKTAPSLTGLKKRIEALTPDQRAALGDLLVLVVNADGVVAPGEVRMLEKIFQMLGTASSVLYAKLHGGAASEPVTVRPSEPRDSAYKLPPKPVAPSTDPMKLDMAKVAALKVESAKVSSLLGSIFKEEDAVVAPAPVEPDLHETPETPDLLGLDADHAGLLQTLLSRPEWSRAELEDICSDRGLMVDGALERINEAAFDALNEPLIEGDDPIEVHRDRLLDRTA